MYFASRIEAGYRLALELLQYRYENCAVVSLSDGGIQVGYQIAASLHSTLAMLLLEDISLPGENMTFGTLSQSGSFTYNGMLSAGEIEAYYSEYRGYVEDEKRTKMGAINRLLGAGGIVDASTLHGRNVMLVSDGLETGASLDAAADFLKPISLERIIIATPVASVAAVDRMHIVGDELHVLSVTDNYMGTDHYYDVNDVPTHETTIAMLNDMVLGWR